MRPIPAKLKKELLEDPYYKHCCITGMPVGLTKIDWHHNFQYAGRQINEKWCILPVAAEDGAGNNFHRYHGGFTRDIQERLDWIMLNRADEITLLKYSKAVDLIKKRDRLNKKFGCTPTGIKTFEQWLKTEI